MASLRSDLLDAVQPYPTVLLDCEGIVRWFENYPGSQIAGPKKNVAPDLLRFRVTAYPGAQPSETWGLVVGDERIPSVKDIPKALL
jgi:hypothetical protein